MIKHLNKSYKQQYQFTISYKHIENCKKKTQKNVKFSRYLIPYLASNFEN